jgi:N-acetylmuramoyl-L-alanine amidase
VDRVNVSLAKPVPIQTIANAAGTTYREIKRLNPIYRSDDIPAGNHEIKLPVGTGQVFELNFRPGGLASAETVSPENSTGQDLPARAAPAVTRTSASALSSDSVSDTSAKPRTSKSKQKIKEKFYQVKKGDSLSSIAKHHNVSPHELKVANKLKSDVLAPGQKLRIP